MMECFFDRVRDGRTRPVACWRRIRLSWTFDPPTISMSHNEVANAFVTHYYQTFDQSVMNLAALYVSLRYVA